MTESVWLVTTGSYSDYHVMMGFTTEQLANDYVAAYRAAREGATYPGDDLTVEEYPLYRELPPQKRVYWHAQVEIHDATMSAPTVTAMEPSDDRPMPDYSVFDHNYGSMWVVFVDGPDRETALQKVRELAVDRLARGMVDTAESRRLRAEVCEYRNPDDNPSTGCTREPSGWIYSQVDSPPRRVQLPLCPEHLRLVSGQMSAQAADKSGQ